MGLLRGREWVPLSASEIYRAVFHADQIRGSRLTVSPAESSPGVRFEFGPLQVGLRVWLVDQSALNVAAVGLLQDGTWVATPHEDDHLLNGHVWFSLNHAELERTRSWISSHAEDGRLSYDSYPLIYRDLTDVPILDEVPGDDIALLAPEVALPEHLNANLYSYQVTGYRWLMARSLAGYGAILADEMGLGKTLQVLAVVERQRESGVGPALVICPLTVMGNWAREIARFAPRVRVYRHRGTNRVRRPAAVTGVDLVLTSYETAASDAGMLGMVRWSLVVVDEAQAIRNPDTLRATAIKRIGATSHIAVTGTPIENRSLDLWSLADFATPGHLGSRREFEASLEDDPDRLRRAVNPIMLRREVKAVAADLPERIDIDSELEMFAAEAAAYEALREDIRSRVDGGSALELLTKLRLFTAHPHTIPPVTGRPSEVSAKFARLMDILNEIRLDGEKAVVFAAFRVPIDLIAQHARFMLNIPVWVLDGRTPADDRQSFVDSFSRAEGPALMVLNPAAAGVGLNIQAASHVIHYTLEWNPAKEDQATARVWRRGQTTIVRVHRLYYGGTVDQALLDTLASKRTMTADIIRPRDVADSELLDLLRRALAMKLPTEVERYA